MDTSKRSAIPIETNPNKRPKTQTGSSAGEISNMKDVKNTLAESKSESESIIAHLQAALEARDVDQQRQDHRYKSLDGNFRKAKNDLKLLRQNVKDLEKGCEMSEEKQTSIDNALRPYAELKNICIDDSSDIVLQYVVDDAMQANKLQGTAHHLQERIQTLCDERQVLLNKVQKLSDMDPEQAPQKQLMDMHHQVKTLSKHVDDYQNEISILHERFQTGKEQNEASGLYIKDLESQSRMLSEQVQNLQNEALKKVDRFKVISDDHFEREFRAIAASIKALSRVNKIPEHIDITKALPAVNLLSKVLPHHWTGRMRKKVYIEAWLWAAVMDAYLEQPFAALEGYPQSLSVAWTQIFGKGHCNSWPVPTSSCEQWRYISVNHLEELVHGNHALDAFRLAHGHSTAPVADPRSNITRIIEDHLRATYDGFKVSGVREIVDKAIALAMRMSSQRSRLQITYPGVGTKYDNASMTSISDRDGEAIHEGVVAVVVNPGLTKWGDAHGLNFDQRHDIVPALVQLEPAMSTITVMNEVAGHFDTAGVLPPAPQPEAETTIKSEPDLDELLEIRS